uniref:Envoplakin-like n=1 Tax=Neolamprologus brichardi TaxID=32507 RepID=A0A3Q4GEQ8_NEOBR
EKRKSTLAQELAVLITRMQKNADQVEKNILQAEKLLRKGNNEQLLHKKENADNLAQAEKLLKDLFMDVGGAKKLQHPQAKEIEKDVGNLHYRWAKDCATFREVYESVQDVDLTQKIGWGPLFDEKLKQLRAEAYGPKLSDVERQIAAHNLRHQEILAYQDQLKPKSAFSCEGIILWPLLTLYLILLIKVFISLLNNGDFVVLWCKINPLSPFKDILKESVCTLNYSCTSNYMNMKRNEQRLAALKELSDSVVPLKLRRMQLSKLTTVISLCDWIDEEGAVRRGEKLTLKSISDNNNWKLQDSSGKTKTLSAACFMIPPPDPEALETVNRYNHDSFIAVKSPENPRVAELLSELGKINKDLEALEKEILRRARTPLDNRNPTQDLANRLQEHEVNMTSIILQWHHEEKSAIQREVDPILAKKPLGPTASALPPKLNNWNRANVSFLMPFLCRYVVKQAMSKDVASKKDELKKLGKELDLTEQACNSLQQNLNEYCPDIRRQEDQVKNLKNRYTSVNSQLQERSALVQQAVNKNQDFQSAVQSLDFFLVNLPDNKIKPTDGVAQITSKENSQKVSGSIFSLLFSLLRSCRFCITKILIIVDGNKNLLLLLQEKDLLNRFAEVSAENNQLLNQLGTAKNIMAMNEEKITQVAVTQQLQLQSQMKDQEQSDSLKKELSEEVNRRLHAENNLDTYRKRFMSLKNRRGVERLEEKEVVQYYRDPKLEMELKSLKSRIEDEALKRSGTKTEIEINNEKIIKLELQLTKVEPKLVTKILTEYEKDPQLDKEAAKLRDEIQRLRLELQTRNTEAVQVKKEITVLAQQKQKIIEKVVKKEVVRLEKDPEMLKAVLLFQSDIAEEEYQCKALNDHIFSTRSQINTLERVIPTIQPKVITKVVSQVRQDPETVEESNKLRMALEEEKDENVILMKDLTTLQLRYSELENLRPKVEVKEIINEIYRVDPETEVEMIRLRKELQDSSQNRTDTEKEIDTVTKTLVTLRAQKPKVEYKEVTQEVIKEEKSPEVIRELQRLNNQMSRLQVNYDTTIELLTHLRKERDELKAEKTKVETQLVNKDIIKYENDPLLEKEVDRLRRNLREETQQRRSLEECVFDLQNQHITLERQKPEEKILKQEVVRLQKDPKQILEHEKLNKKLDDETKTRRKLELEVRQLRALIQDKEIMLAQLDDRQKKIQVESELRQIKARILELENTPPPIEERIIVEEVLKVEKDPQLDKLIGSIHDNLETEGNEINRLEREIRNIKLKLETLQKEKSIEKVVYREVVRVEKDPAVEAEREQLRELVTKERNLRRNQEDNNQSMHLKMTHLQTSKSVTSQEETTLISIRDALQRDKEDLLKQFKALESQRQSISITFQQQSKLMSERNLMVRQRSLKTSSEIQRLETEILKEKDKIHEKDKLIIEILDKIKHEDHSETKTREANLSTKVTILDPETGKNLSPYDAYLQGLIDRNQYIKLSELECDWEEITSTGPGGDTVILHDRKSGNQYSVMDALREGRLTQRDVSRYKEGKMPISEFALLVAGERSKPYVPPLISMSSSLRSSYTNLNTQYSGSLGSLTNLSALPGDEFFPISGIFDTTTESRMSVRSALTRGLIDADTALKLLEAQAATGGIVDLGKKDKLSVHKAAEKGLIDTNQKYKLLNAQKAFTGVEDPVTKQRLAVGQAAQKGFIPQENARRYLEAQYLTGGLVDPTKAGRLTIKEALATGLIDSTTAKDLQDEASHTKELVDPISKGKISYKQAMDLCRKDFSTGLFLNLSVFSGYRCRFKFPTFGP